jgi:hypothetical protein
MGIIRGSEGSVMVLEEEADSAGSLVLSKGLLPSVLEVGGAICGLGVTSVSLAEARELDEDEGIAVDGI